MPAVSKAQQRFMGMVHAAQKGDMENPSPEVQKAADSMSDKDAKDYASTPHKGLPNKKENMITRDRLKEIVKEVMVEEAEYQTFFKKALEKAGKGINDMSDDEKKAFFNKIDSAWNGKGEKNEELTGNQHKLDIDKDGDIGSDDLADLRAGKKVDEGVSSSDMDKIKGAVEAAKSFMSVGAELKKLGMRYTFATEPLPIYIIQPTPNNRVAIVNKKYVSKPDFVVGDIAVGVMEGKVNEAFKHIISVDTPTQVVSKPIAAQILALAKKGVRSNEIGLKMGFVGNQKAATDAFQKVKNQIYFKLDK